jgi:hypothetical protein
VLDRSVSLVGGMHPRDAILRGMLGVLIVIRWMNRWMNLILLMESWIPLWSTK